MNKTELFESITIELNSLKNRVRNFIGDAHWLSDGEWKESVLKSIIRRHIPTNVGVGSGFIVNENDCTTQIDIILYDLNKPILFKDGDFVIVTPDSVRGIIEVKTNIENISRFDEFAEKIAKNISFIRNNHNHEYLFTCLFSYDTGIPTDIQSMESLLQILKKNSKVQNGILSEINHITLGKNIFIKFWEEDPSDKKNKVYNTWHGYKLNNKSPAYFLMNAVIEVSDNRYGIKDYLWFPPEGKEGNILAKLKLTK